jgi:hypothetical protein
MQCKFIKLRIIVKFIHINSSVFSQLYLIRSLYSNAHLNKNNKYGEKIIQFNIYSKESLNLSGKIFLKHYFNGLVFTKADILILKLMDSQAIFSECIETNNLETTNQLIRVNIL